MPNVSFILAYYKIYNVRAKESLYANVYLHIPVFFFSVNKQKFRLQQYRGVVYLAWKTEDTLYYSNDLQIHHPKCLYERLLRSDY